MSDRKTHPDQAKAIALYVLKTAGDSWEFQLGDRRQEIRRAAAFMRRIGLLSTPESVAAVHLGFEIPMNRGPYGKHEFDRDSTLLATSEHEELMIAAMQANNARAMMKRDRANG